MDRALLHRGHLQDAAAAARTDDFIVFEDDPYVELRFPKIFNLRTDPFEEGDLGVLADVGLPEAVLSVILDETDLYPDEQLGRIAREMGFAEELGSWLARGLAQRAT